MASDAQVAPQRFKSCGSALKGSMATEPGPSIILTRLILLRKLRHSLPKPCASLSDSKIVVIDINIPFLNLRSHCRSGFDE
jgi:hypothetical protein